MEYKKADLREVTFLDKEEVKKVAAGYDQSEYQGCPVCGYGDFGLMQADDHMELICRRCGCIVNTF